MKKGSLLIAALGAWLIAAPFSFGFEHSKMLISDVISGFFLLVFGLFFLRSEKKILLYLAALVGIWLQLAPLCFWAQEPSSYLNDTFVGMSVILLVFSLPKMEDEEKGDETPPGWSFNPSALAPRRVTVFLALIAWFLARYLASYQLGYIHTIEDPLFGDGTLKVISSSIANQFPVSDAGLGSFGYSLEFALGLIGSSRRWKTMPWITIVFGMMVIPAGMISILLIVLQPLIVGAWCGVCLGIALCMLVMVLLTIPEMAATLKLLVRAKKNRIFWSVFWKGDISASSPPSKPLSRNLTSKYGFTLPWNLLASILLGAWVLYSPHI